MKNKEKMKRWPNFFIVGAPKAGTTTLFEYLKKIPYIYTPSIKEPQFFSRTVLPRNQFWSPIRNEEEYLKLYENVTNEKIQIDASTTYFFDPDAPFLIQKSNPEAKILILLRDPVERTFSNYLHLMRITRYFNLGILEKTFHKQLHKELNQEVDYNIPHIRLYVGNYSKFVKSYLDTFGKQQVKIIIFEEFISKPHDTLSEILKFLNIDYTISQFQEEKHNIYYGPQGKISYFLLSDQAIRKILHKVIPENFRKKIVKNTLLGSKFKPKLENEDRLLLINYYRDDVIKLEKILSRKLPWKNFI